jgi:hypothetical protein
MVRSAVRYVVHSIYSSAERMNAPIIINTLAAAFDYAARGWPVFPCNQTKAPHTPNGYKDATTDAATIYEWWLQWPQAMIGMPTGPASGVWVLDVDDPEAFAESCPIDLPRTRKAITGKGFHLYFQHNDARPVRNAQRHPVKGWPFVDMPGAEVRGEGGYIILPPSRHPSGRFYSWEVECEPAPAPAELLRIVTRQGGKVSKVPPEGRPAPLALIGWSDTPYGLAALQREADAILHAGNGEQESALNEAGLKIGAVIAGGELSLVTATARLIAAGLAMPSYNSGNPWTVEAIAAKVKRALSDGATSPRSAPPRHDRDPTSVLGTRADCSIPATGGPSPLASTKSISTLISAAPYRWREPASIPRRQWLFGRWLLRGEVTAIFAPGGAGKSTLSTAIAVSLASGRDLLGQDPKGQVGAWLYNLEDAPDELDRQLAATCLWHVVERDECNGRLFINSGIEMPLCTASEENGAPLINEQAFAQLADTIRRKSIGVVVIDPLVSSHRVSEASNEAIDAIVKRWKRLAHETGCAVVLVHHTRKLQGREATAEDGRGAVALRDAARVVLVLNKVTANEAQTVGISDPKIYRSLVKVDVGKASRAPGADTTWLKLESQSLGNGDETAPPDFVGVATLFDKPDVFSGMSAWHICRVQQRLDERDWRDSVQAKDWVGNLVAEVAGLDANGDRGKIKAIIKEWKRTGALVIEHRADRNGENRPCIAIGNPIAPDEGGSPHLGKVGAESAVSADE